MIQPHLIVIAGPPAAGKTTLARQIARALRLPLICKDTLKESLFDHLGAGGRAQSQRLGYAVICCMYALAEEILLAGASLILESTFVHADTPGELEEVLDSTGAHLSVVYCYAAPETLCERFNARARSDRHPGHQDQAITLTPGEIVTRGWLQRPDYPGNVIPVDTTDPDAIPIAGILRRLAG